jgi:predicted component of type VI protein secretion system
MSSHKKLTHQQHSDEAQTHSQEQLKQTKAREYGSVEELLREDAQNTKVPAAIAERLQKTMDGLQSAERKAWWRRLFGA